MLLPFVDSLDLVYSAQRSLMIGVRSDRWDISSKDKLLRLAKTILARKVSRAVRKAKSERKTQEMAARNGPARNGPSKVGAALAEENDLFAEIRSRLDETEQRLFDLLREGHTIVTAAHVLGLDPDFLRVKWWRARKNLAAGLGGKKTQPKAPDQPGQGE